MGKFQKGVPKKTVPKPKEVDAVKSEPAEVPVKSEEQEHKDKVEDEGQGDPEAIVEVGPTAGTMSMDAITQPALHSKDCRCYVCRVRSVNPYTSMK